jgi:hypothetical protein
MTSGSNRAAQFGVQCLDGVRRVNDSANRDGKGKKRNDVPPVSPPTLRDCRIFLTQGRSVKLLERLFAGAASVRRPNPRPPGSRTKSFCTYQASAPRTTRFSRLNGWPMRSPADASPSPSWTPPHGSGPMRIATPSLQATSTAYSLPVSTGAPKASPFRRRAATSCTGCIRSSNILWMTVREMGSQGERRDQDHPDFNPVTPLYCLR